MANTVSGPSDRPAPVVVSEAGRVTITVPGMFTDATDPTELRIVSLLTAIPGIQAVEIRRGQGASIVLSANIPPTPEQLRAIADSFRAVSPAAVAPVPPAAPVATAPVPPPEVVPEAPKPEEPAPAKAPDAEPGGGLLSRNNVLMVVFIPLTLYLEHADAPPLLTFLAAAACLIPLASLLEKATESLAAAFGPTIGAMLNSTLGNLPEIIISVTALQKGLDAMVKGAIVGAVIGNLLLSLGIAMFLGGFRRPSLKFNTLAAGMSGNLLFLGVAAMLVPLLFNLTHNNASDKEISREIAGVLLVTYLLSLVFSLITHRQYLGTAKEGHEQTVDSGSRWGVARALIVLALAAVGIAGVSDVLTAALTPAAKLMGLSDVFAGMFLLAAAGNLPETLNVVSFARKGNMELAFTVTLQSCTQMVVFVAPLLVFISYFAGGSMDLVFAPFAATALVMTVLGIRGLLTDGETNWMEGVFLIALYVLLAIGVFHLPTPTR